MISYKNKAIIILEHRLLDKTVLQYHCNQRGYEQRKHNENNGRYGTGVK